MQVLFKLNRGKERDFTSVFPTPYCYTNLAFYTQPTKRINTQCKK